MESDLTHALTVESQRIEEDALHSAKGHFEAAAAWSRTHYRLGIPTTALAAIAGGSAIKNHLELAAIVGLAVTALSALSVFLNPSERAGQHHAAGTRFNEVRNRARVFRQVDLRSGTALNDLQKELKVLGTTRDELNKSSPQIPRWAFERARRGIAAGEASYAVDASGRRRKAT